MAAPEVIRRALSARDLQPLKGVRVLVVDDAEETRQLVKTMLEYEGAEATVADSVAEALKCVARSAPDVLLSDLSLPDGTGYDLLRQIRHAETRGGRKLAAAALTGRGDPEDRRRCESAGFQAHLVKPIAPDRLVSIVAMLGRR
jgi:CheY-like chemotaxis protein